MDLLFQTNAIIEWGGFIVIVLLVFAETGFLLGLIIPGGETLLFTAGLLASTGTFNSPFSLLLLALILAGFAGDVCGYAIGKKLGSTLYNKKDTWYFKKQYLHGAEQYLKKHSQSALIFGKFLPVVRPFMPALSGVTKMPGSCFIPLSILSASIYVSLFTLIGFFLGNRFPVVKQYIGWIIPISITITVLIAIRQIKKLKRLN